MNPITVGITTRNRPRALARAVASLECAADLIEQVLVFDDASNPAAGPVSSRAVYPRPLHILRVEEPHGCIIARNRLVAAAATSFVFLMDDDAALLSRAALEAALGVCRKDRRAAAIAFAQASLDGQSWPATMQPALCSVPSIVRSFIGYAHLLRRDVFLEAGGYQELFGFQGEEKDLCVRLIDRGYHIVYLPDARVAHEADPSGRDSRVYLRHVTRNDCLTSVINDPFPRPLWIVPARLALYFRMRRGWNISDPGGFGWILKQLRHALPDALRQRRPVSRRTLREWRRLGREGVPYEPRGAAVV